jgi:branched-chain amino acid transport system substrate-binding protein
VSAKSRKAITQTWTVIIITIIAVAAIAGAAFYWITLPEPSSTDPIKIGLLIPLSGGGAYDGEYAYEGIKLAADEINDAGGVLGRKVTIIAEDSRGVPAEGVAAATKLMADHRVCAIIGGFFSSISLAVCPEIEKGKTPLIEIAATNPQLRQKYGKEDGWYFRMNPDNPMEAALFGDTIVSELNYKKIFYVMEDTDWGRGAVESFTPTLTSAGGEIVGTEYFPKGETNFMPIITKIQSVKPDVIIGAIMMMEGINFFRQRNELGDETPFINLDSLASTDFVEAVTAPVAEGIMAFAAWSDTLQTAECQDFVQKYAARYGRNPTEDSPFAYAALYTVVRAIEIAGSDDNEAIRNALRQVDIRQGEKYGFIAGIIGPVKFDDQNQAHVYEFVIQIQDGVVVELKKVLT